MSRAKLLSKPCRLASSLLIYIFFYMAFCNVASALHTLTILQAYQAHFKRDLNEGTAVDAEAVGAVDLALRSTKLEERSKILFTALLVQY